MRISDWSSDVCSSDLLHRSFPGTLDPEQAPADVRYRQFRRQPVNRQEFQAPGHGGLFGRRSLERLHQLRRAQAIRSDDPGELVGRSEEHTSELQSLMRISYAVFCLKKKIKTHKLYNKQRQTNQHNL